mgnify:CR=1 FL=1
MKFAYADPPYFKQGKKHYGKLHDEAEIWDGRCNCSKTCPLTCDYVNELGRI